jgi:hypothetical protein
MSNETRRAFLQSDREDLLTVLTLRFGSVPESVHAHIAACDNAATLERWILVAANVPDWVSFLNDLDAGPQAFRLVGASYEPNPTGFSAKSGSTTTPRRALGAHKSHLPDGARPKKEE